MGLALNILFVHVALTFVLVDDSVQLENRLSGIYCDFTTQVLKETFVFVSREHEDEKEGGEIQRLYVWSLEAASENNLSS